MREWLEAVSEHVEIGYKEKFSTERAIRHKKLLREGVMAPSQLVFVKCLAKCSSDTQVNS